MNVYTCTGFKGHWPVGTSAVVVANDKAEGAELLSEALRRAGLMQGILPDDLSQISTVQPRAYVLNDGDY